MDKIEFRFLYLLQELHTPLVDGLMTFITSLGDHGIFWLLLAAVLFAVPRTRMMGGCMLISIGIGFLLGNVALKNMVARQRPCWLDPSVGLLVQVPRDFSLYRKFLLNHELCKQIALQKQGTENRRLRLEDIKTFFSKIVIVDIIKFM